MNRKKFLKRAILTGAAGAIAPQLLSAYHKEAIKSTLCPLEN